MKSKVLLGLILVCMAAWGAVEFGDIEYLGDIQMQSTLVVGSSSPDASAAFEVQSTTKGSKACPEMTEAQRDAISSPDNGLCVYNSDDNELNFYDGSAWQAFASLGGSQTFTNKTHTNPVLNGSISGTGVLDEDNLVSDSATALATQQSIKAYVDDSIGAPAALTVESETASFTASTGNLYLVDTSAGDVTATLDTASGESGKEISFKITDNTNDLILDGNGSETIDGSTTITRDNLDTTYTIVSDGSNWQLKSDYYANLALGNQGGINYISSAFISAQSGTPSVSREETQFPGGFIASITDGGVGDYRINFESGIYTSTSNYSCVISTQEVNRSMRNSDEPGGVAVDCTVSSTSAAADCDFTILCVGI